MRDDLTDVEKAVIRLREAWASEIHPEYGDEAQHPDERAVWCPPQFLLDDEWEERHGRGHVLPDGAWYDPVADDFFGFTTITD